MNNLKAERTLTAEELQAIIDGCAGVTPGPWTSEKGGRGSWIKGSTGEWSAMGCGDSDKAADANSDHIARLDPDTVKAMAMELQHLRSQSLSTQQTMGEPVAWEITDYAMHTGRHFFESLERAEYWRGIWQTRQKQPVKITPLYALHPNQESGE